MPGNSLVLVLGDGTRTSVDGIEGLTAEFRGDDSVIEIGVGSVFRNSKIILGSGGLVRIGTTHPRGLNNTTIDMSGKGIGKVIEIGAGTSIEGCRFAMGGGQRTEIRLGENCLLSSNLVFRANDGHVVFDRATGLVVNRPRPIIVGNHVWVGASATFVKGSAVADDTIIGTQSVVSRRFDEKYTVIAGNPAQIVKRNVGWDRAHIEDYVETLPAG